MNDLSFLTDWIDPRVAAVAIAATEWLKSSILPERFQKGRAIRIIALLVVAFCYIGVWASQASAEIRHVGYRIGAIVATYALSKVGYEVTRKVGTDAPTVTSDVQEVVVSPPRVESSDVPVSVTGATETRAPATQAPQNVHGVYDVTGGNHG